MTAPLTRVRWAQATRIIASRFPPIDLYERVSDDPADWEALIKAEMLVNPRLRDAVGDIALVPPEERVSGPGATWVMASFTHLNPKGSRFSDGSYGVYYAAADLATAIAETAYHFGRFAADSGDGPRREDMRVLVGRVDAEFHDVAALDAERRARILHPSDYAEARAFGAALRAEGSNGVVYPSVRRAGGACIGAFRPKAVGAPVQERHLQYHWDGIAVRRYFDYREERWFDLPG